MPVRGRPDDPTPDNVERQRQRHPDQLSPGVYPPYNQVIHGPPDTDIGSIWWSLSEDPDGYAITSVAFDLDERHQAMIAAGAHVQLNMWQVPMPPVSVAVEGPYCKCHDLEMAFDQESGSFYCRTHDMTREDVDALEAARREFEPTDDPGAPDAGPDDAGDGPAAPGDDLAR
jgi:hypothetical protein